MMQQKVLIYLVRGLLALVPVPNCLIGHQGVSIILTVKVRKMLYQSCIVGNIFCLFDIIIYSLTFSCGFLTIFGNILCESRFFLWTPAVQWSFFCKLSISVFFPWFPFLFSLLSVPRCVHLSVTHYIRQLRFALYIAVVLYEEFSISVVIKCFSFIPRKSRRVNTEYEWRVWTCAHAQPNIYGFYGTYVVIR